MQEWAYFSLPDPADAGEIYDYIHRGWVEQTGKHPTGDEIPTIVLVVGILNQLHADRRKVLEDTRVSRRKTPRK